MTARTCRHCSTGIQPAGKSGWVDADGWELCTHPDHEFHEPADTVEVSVSEATTAGLARLARDAEVGQMFVITRHGRPIARLVPYGVELDDVETFEELMDVAEQAFGRVRGFARAHMQDTATGEGAQS